MQMKKARNARMIFAFMVPLTLIAFWIAAATNPGLIKIENLDVYDTLALAVSTVGVFMYNWFEEKPQKASIENI